jgi:hypothetical protein
MIPKARHLTLAPSLFGKLSPIGRHMYKPQLPLVRSSCNHYSTPPDIPICSIFTTGYTVALFTPTIVHDLGYSAANAQLLSVPPFACAGVSTIIICFFSDKANLRGPFLVLCSTISMIGYIIAYNTSQPGPGYVATVFAASGAYPNVALVLAWAGGNAGGNMKRGVVLALVIGLGNLGGCVFHLGPKLCGRLMGALTTRMSNRRICSSFIYYQPPRFHTGHGTVLGCLGTRYVLARHRKEEVSHRSFA